MTVCSRLFKFEKVGIHISIHKCLRCEKSNSFVLKNLSRLLNWFKIFL